MLGTAGLAAAASLFLPAAGAAKGKGKVVVPAPVYYPTRYRPEIDLAGKNIVIAAERGIAVRRNALDCR
jgi:hypothetical protein